MGLHCSELPPPSNILWLLWLPQNFVYDFDATRVVEGGGETEDVYCLMDYE